MTYILYITCTYYILYHISHAVNSDCTVQVWCVPSRGDTDSPCLLSFCCSLLIERVTRNPSGDIFPAPPPPPPVRLRLDFEENEDDEAVPLLMDLG